MAKIEYRYISKRSGTSLNLKELNDIGKDGWIMCMYDSSGDFISGNIYMFYRPIKTFIIKFSNTKPDLFVQHEYIGFLAKHDDANVIRSVENPSDPNIISFASEYDAIKFVEDFITKRNGSKEFRDGAIVVKLLEAGILSIVSDDNILLDLKSYELCKFES